ncbi:hypothetical protein HZB96_04250 [Candidatus Gottesmanbacteria bacterium]|nr:hypothetical protein [Candidatus Gottesmanbacteria bacterium]
MSTIEQTPQVGRVETQLSKMGLSRGAIDNMRIAGDFIKDHAWMAALAGGWLAGGAANMQLHDYGPIANFNPLAVLNPSYIEGQHSANSVLSASQISLLLGAGLGSWEGVRNLLTRADVKAGLAPNPYRRFVAMVDTTNEVVEGSTHGDFYQELYRVLDSHPEVYKRIKQKFGPICELVPAGIPLPIDIPKIRYFRLDNPANTLLLKNLVRAERARATVVVHLKRAHTVWDPQSNLTLATETITNMNRTIEDTCGAGNIPNIIIINNRATISHGFPATDVDDTQKEKIRITVPSTAEIDFRNKGYRVINAERTAMNYLISTRLKANYTGKRILLVDDGTDEGMKIALNWLQDYQKMKSGDDPEVFLIPNENKERVRVLKEGLYDGIFLIGAEDNKVADSAFDIITKQTPKENSQEPEYKPVPLDVLMEGRGSADKMHILEKRGGKVHFVHEILVKKFIMELLGDYSIWTGFQPDLIT